MPWIEPVTEDCANRPGDEEENDREKSHAKLQRSAGRPLYILGSGTSENPALVRIILPEARNPVLQIPDAYIDRLAFQVPSIVGDQVIEARHTVVRRGVRVEIVDQPVRQRCQQLAFRRGRTARRRALEGRPACG